ncbi:MAG TPA: NDP-sugar synthase [Pyrinomonadaceae bacterium]|jgi:NDP-sugar pyrophosphorylase family protein|nr:NDP-sugar synthase [Pyrinomonadaceae bacterium]
MRAMILAAGKSTRLWPLTIDRAKPAIPFMGRPLVGYVAEYLARHGCTEVLVNLHHRPESVRGALGDGSAFGVRLRYVEEPEILGTSGALDNARALLEDETFVVVNGKIATDINLDAALETHRRTGALATLVLRPNPARERYSTVITRDGLIRGFGPMPQPPETSQPSDASDNAGSAARASQNSANLHSPNPPATAAGETTGNAKASDGGKATDDRQAGKDSIGETDTGGNSVGVPDDDADVPLMFTGIHIIEPRIFEYIPRGVFSDSAIDVYPKAIERGEPIAAHVAAGMWYELSTVKRYLDTSLALMRREGRDVETCAGATIQTGAEVSDAVLWENVTVERGARVRRAVLGADVRARAGVTWENVAVVRAQLARVSERPEKGLRGEFDGENFVAPLPG